MRACDLTLSSFPTLCSSELQRQPWTFPGADSTLHVVLSGAGSQELRAPTGPLPATQGSRFNLGEDRPGGPHLMPEGPATSGGPLVLPAHRDCSFLALSWVSVCGFESFPFPFFQSR